MGRNYIVCVKSSEDGNTYCYDAERCKWVIVNEQEVSIRQVPEDILSIAFEAAFAKNKEG